LPVQWEPGQGVEDFGGDGRWLVGNFGTPFNPGGWKEKPNQFLVWETGGNSLAEKGWEKRKSSFWGRQEN